MNIDDISDDNESIELKKEQNVEIVLVTETQFYNIWKYINNSKVKDLKTKFGKYKTQLSSIYFDDTNKIIYSLKLIDWISNIEHFAVETNDLYQATKAGMSLEGYAAGSFSQYYDSKYIQTLMGINESQARTFMKDYNGVLKVKDKYYIPRAIFDSQRNLEKVREQKVNIQNRTLKIIAERRKITKVINEIDNEKMALISDSELYLNIEIKLCQDDCLKGQNGECEFYDYRDNVKGLRSTCIYLRRHATLILEFLEQYYNKTKDNFKTFTKKQEIRLLIAAELSLRYKLLQLPYISTILEVTDSKGNKTTKVCHEDMEIIKISLAVKAQWRILGLEPPELKTMEKSFGKRLSERK